MPAPAGRPIHPEIKRTQQPSGPFASAAAPARSLRVQDGSPLCWPACQRASMPCANASHARDQKQRNALAMCAHRTSAGGSWLAALPANDERVPGLQACPRFSTACREASNARPDEKSSRLCCCRSTLTLHSHCCSGAPALLGPALLHRHAILLLVASHEVENRACPHALLVEMAWRTSSA